jgi:hypothetical protein
MPTNRNPRNILEHPVDSDCYCDNCERIRNDLAREARAEERVAHAERLAYPARHPLVWR